MVTKEELKKSPEKKLTDEELGKVAGGSKDWEEDDLEAGQVFLYWQNETTWCYRKIIYISYGNMAFFEYRINKNNVNDYSKARYENQTVHNFVKGLNKMIELEGFSEILKDQTIPLSWFGLYLESNIEGIPYAHKRNNYSILYKWFSRLT